MTSNSLVSFLQAGMSEQPHGLRSAAVAQVIAQLPSQAAGTADAANAAAA